MLIHADTFCSVPTRPAAGTIAVVGKRPDRRVLDAALKTDCDVVLIESFAEAYSHIKRLAPQAVIVCLDIDDLDGVEILSMLNLDKATAQIPLVTYLTGADAQTTGEEGSDLNHEAIRRMDFSSMN